MREHLPSTDLDFGENRRREDISAALTRQPYPSINHKLGYALPDPEYRLHLYEAGKEEVEAVIVDRSAKFKVLEEVNDRGGVEFGVHTLEGGQVDVAGDRLELRNDRVFRGEGGAKYPQPQPHGVQDDYVTERAFPDVHNLWTDRQNRQTNKQ